MSYFEQYAMGIPLFTPSLDLMTRLHIKHGFVVEKTPGIRRNHSLINHHDNYNGSARLLDFDSRGHNIILDPQNDFDYRAVRHWLALSDYYVCKTLNSWTTF